MPLKGNKFWNLNQLNMTKQIIAVRLSKINWQQVQGDCVHENENVNRLKDQLMHLPQREAIEVLIKVIEANELSKQIPEIFSDMLEFKYVNF